MSETEKVVIKWMLLWCVWGYLIKGAFAMDSGADLHQIQIRSREAIMETLVVVAWNINRGWAMKAADIWERLKKTKADIIFLIEP